MTETSETALPTLNQADCTNCGVPLSGKFCHDCGQSSRSMVKFFGEVLKELLDDILGYDSRLKHSILPLLFKPGKLTLEYIKGRRFYYVMPFRLYLITSIILLFFIQLNIDTENIKITPKDSNQLSAENQQSQDVKKIVDGLGDKISDKQKQTILSNVNKPIFPEQTIDETPKKKNTRNFGFNFVNGKPVYYPWIVEEEGPIKIFADEINAKAPLWLKNPKPLLDELFKIAPYMMLFIIPIFAIFQKLFYAFSKRFYIEHLIFSLHNHSFFYLALLASLATESSVEHLRTMEGWLAQTGYYIFNVLDFLIVFWILSYILIATKRVYQQGWWMTISKTLALGLIYFILSLFGMVSTILIGAYTA